MPVRDASVPDAKGKPADLTNPEARQGEFLRTILAARQEAATQKAVEDALGIGGEKENLGSTIITKSMDITDRNLERQGAEVEKLRKEREATNDKLYQERMAHYNTFFTEREARLKDIEDRIAKASQQPGSTSIEIYKQVKGELASLFNEMEQFKKGTMGAQVGVGLDAATAIKLKQMELDQAIALNEMQEDRMQKQREWELTKLKWEDEKTFRWEQFHSSEKTKQGAWSGLSDLAASIGENVQITREGIAEQPPPAEQKEQEIQAEITSFLCPLCKTKIMLPENAVEAICPNEECQATFKVENSGK